MYIFCRAVISATSGGSVSKWLCHAIHARRISAESRRYVFHLLQLFHLCNSLLNKSTSVLHGKHLRHSEMLITPISKYFIRIQPRANSDELMKVLDGINHSRLGKCE
jgi:DNA polymerase V